MAKTSFLLSLLTVLVLSPLLSAAQTGNETANEVSDKVVRIIRFVGNDHVKDNTLEDLIRTSTNREFLGIPRFTPWYFLHQLTGSLGEPPSLLDRATVATDMERIQRYYESIGFLDAEVDTSITEFREDRVEVSFLIEEGRAAEIQTVSWSGMPDLEDPRRLQTFYGNSALVRRQVDDTTWQVNRRYSEASLREEQTRTITFLRNNGYASVQRDSVTALVRPDPQDPYRLDLMYAVRPGQIYRFGDLHISLAGPEGEATYEQRDTLHGDPWTADSARIYLEKQPEAHARFSLLTDQILFTPGEVFDHSLYIRSINEFQNLGMMSIQQFGLSEDGTLPDYTEDEIPVMFSLQTLPRHSVNFNLFGLRRYGFGSGAGISYTNNNLFGKAENFQIGFNGSFEYVRSETLRDIAPAEDITYDSSLFRSYDIHSEYSLPRLIFPLTAFDDRIFFSNVRTRYTLTFSRSNQLLFDINSDVRFNLRYEIYHNNRFSSFLDLIELDVLDTDPTEPFEQSLEEEFGRGSFEFQRIMEDFRPQVSSILRYTFRSRRTDLIKRNYGYFSEYSISMGGNVPWLVDRYIVTPDTVEGNLPSPIRTSQNSLAYSRFLKGTADYRRYIPLSNDAVFAWRGYAGIAWPYGESRSIPLNQRFYAGGSNDIRGWDFYTLGPGDIPLDHVTINGGEIKLMAQTEVRQRIINSFLSANWDGAWFTDAGNIWYGPRTEFPASPDFTETERARLLEQGKFHFDRFYKQIAVGSGLGVRIDWNYVVARFDFAFRIHDLEEGWFRNRKAYFSFGIGHSF